MTASRAAPLLILLASAAVLGLAPILVRLADTGPAAAGMWRFAFALPWLLLLVWRPGQAAGAGGIGRPSPLMGLAALFFVLDLAFWHYSIRFTSVANATTLTNLTPVIVTAVVWLMFRERPRALFLAALALALFGAWTMSAGADGRQGSDPRLGDLFAAVTALWYAGYFLTVKVLRGRVSASRIMLWTTGLGLPLLLGVAVVLGEPLTPASTAGWLACAGLGLVHVAGQGGVAWALGRLPAALTAVTVLIQPVVAALLGWMLFAETMTAAQLGGAAALLAGVVLAQWSARVKPGPAAPLAGPENKKGAEAETSAPVP
ncbi:DMT family transporter [Brevundimonas basaltis]|uniref:Drug/metabolite transporter (DMT)-like permease n=1 Tax=Brevundimonas basaltis TaxID=472166 RepID=A0A7W8HZ58_9CAUL|nr:DMT family transporter [Brevundimonas basaltis]MBB5292359.1 drug/metabolite transporter (DMT)-like permease [Brevundimonas basaltis]